MAVAGALVGGAIGAYGRKPKVPSFQEVSADDVQQRTVAGNLAAFPEITNLASTVNTFNQDQLNSLIDKALGPGVREQIQGTIAGQLRGEIPQDVSDAVRRNVAQGTAGVFGGSQFSGFKTARDLGLTSLQISQQGLSSAQRWLAQAAAPVFDVTSMFFSPQQRYGYAVNERDTKFARDVAAAQVKAAPDPATAALGKEIDRFFNTWASFGMMAASMGTSQAIGGGAGGAGSMLAGAGGGMGGGGGGGWSGSQMGQNGWSNWLNSQVNTASANGQGV